MYGFASASTGWVLSEAEETGLTKSHSSSDLDWASHSLASIEAVVKHQWDIGRYGMTMAN